MNELFLNIDSSLVGSHVHMRFRQSRADERFTNFLQIESIGQGLYTYGSLWLLVASIILLLAMVGPIVLCLRSSTAVK